MCHTEIRSVSKVKFREGIFVWPQIRQFFKDENFETTRRKIGA